MVQRSRRSRALLVGVAHAFVVPALAHAQPAVPVGQGATAPVAPVAPPSPPVTPPATGVTDLGTPTGTETEQEVARAREAFYAGLAHADRLEWSQAAARFREAYTIRSSPQVAFNLASALEELDRFPEASSLLGDVLDGADTPPEVRARAEELRARLEQRAGRLTLSHEGLLSGDQVFLDGRAVEAREWDRTLWVGPGYHLLAVTRGATEVFRRGLELGRGESVTVVLAVVPSAEELARRVAARGAAPPAPTARRPRLGRDWRLWTVLGVLAATVVTVGLVASLDRRAPAPVRGDFEPGVLSWD